MAVKDPRLDFKRKESDMAEASSPPKNAMGLAPSLRPSGYRLVDAGELFALLGTLFGTSPPVTALGNNAATATRLAGGVVCVTSAAAGTGVMLPPALPGKRQVVINDTATAVLVYAFTARVNDTITPNNSATPGASVSIAANGSAEFVCGKTGNWKETLSA